MKNKRDMQMIHQIDCIELEQKIGLKLDLRPQC